MKKLLLFSIFIGIFCIPVTCAAVKCTHIQSISNNDKTECLTSGTFLQTIGKSQCYSSGATSGDYRFQAFICQSPGMFGTHVWGKADRRFCNDTILNDLYSTNTVFALKDTSGNIKYTMYGGQGGSRGYQLVNGCISVYCQSGYVAPVGNDAGCVSITTKQNEMCKATSAGVYVSDNFKLSIDGETPTTNSTRMICRKQADIAQKYKSEQLKDACAEDIHAFLPKPAGNTANDAKYFTCTNNGWQQQQLNKCAPHDNITSLTSCGTDDNCIIKIYKGTNSAEEVTFPAHDDQYSGGLTTTIRDYCYRFVCADGYTWYNNNCTANATIQAELQEQQRKEQACIASFGTWANNQCTCDPGKHLVYDQPYATCKCKPNYRRDETNKTCVPTDTEAERLACVNMEDEIATWDEDSDKCNCKESGFKWEYDGTTQTGNCEMSPSRAACEQLGENIATWDEDNDRCKCKDNGQEFRDGQCVDTAETIELKANAASSAITTAVNTLGHLISSANLQTSKWKNAEGKFNTARLASDATAGIVLGTTSALITSKLVKKHQVQDGFEDIHCTIGGQTVADWGDEFTIGIQ